MTLYDADKSSNYVRNRATFNPSDDLVLNDGVLYDIDSGKSIHKFDKFNANMSGLFHPNGLEIIINSEVVSFECSVSSNCQEAFSFIRSLFPSFIRFTFRASIECLSKISS